MTQGTRSETFETPAPVRLHVENPKGRVQIVAETTDITRVDLVPTDGLARARVAEAFVGRNGDRIAVEIPGGVSLFGLWGAVDVVVHVPTDSSASISTGSAYVTTSGQLKDVQVRSGSGAIRLDSCRDVRARTGSGAIDVQSALGSVTAETGSGKVSIGQVGGDASIITASGCAELAHAARSAKLKTASGSIDIAEAGDLVEAIAVSGSVHIGRADHGRVRARAISGRISVGVASGTAALLDISTLSGRVHSELGQGAPPADEERHVELTLSTVSGSVSVARA